MKIKKNKTQIYLLLIFVVALLIGVGYAALSATLNINGQTTINKASWDVHMEDINVTSGSVEATTAPTLDTAKTTVNFSVKLTNPGDFYEFTVKEVNKGTIDAMISTISKTGLTETQAKYLDYTVTYSDGTALAENQLLKSNQTETLKVRIDFKKDITAADLPTADSTLNLNFSLAYQQADETATIIKHMILSDDNSNGIADVGEMITIGTERFYVINNNDTNIKALAEYNLLVGYEFNAMYGTSTQLTNPTGLQDSATILNGLIFYGGSDFSTSGYWNKGEEINLNDSKNIINKYLKEYKLKLTDYKGVVDSISLITQSELEELGCDFSNKTCTSAPNWLYQTRYWTLQGGAWSDYIWSVQQDGKLSENYNYSSKSVGIRPVITINVSDL